ncbi:MAG TPA: Ig-like domain-containing protein [Longimicrobiaceae bacterium]|nr:Ig-like domain-containing protein [Longimicrobiaceae bacterium]
MTRPSRWYRPARAIAGAVVATVAVLACTDRSNPVALGPDPPPDHPTSPLIGLGVLECSASVTSRAVSCRAPEPATGARGDIMYGGQDIYVVVTTSGVGYDAGTHKFTFNLKLRNLLRQAIGTSDGLAADPAGVKVFFHQVPTVTGGSGTITVDNADGVGTFTAPNQPYYTYVQLIDSYLESANKPWQFDVPTTATAFEFKLYISSPVQFPHGWIDVSDPTYSLSRTHLETVSGVVRDQYGRKIEGAVITWSSGNNAIATVGPSDGLVTGVTPGAVNITASSTNDVLGTPGAIQTGNCAFTITGTSLVWTAGASTTDWNTPANWDRGVAPLPEDSATIPVLASAIYPALTANQGIGRVQVDDGAQLSLSAFDLTASKDVLAGLSGGITATTGRVLMTGSAQTTSGLLPRMRVSGTYSLAGNVNSTASLRVEGGRLRSTSYRIRVTSQ